MLQLRSNSFTSVIFGRRGRICFILMLRSMCTFTHLNQILKDLLQLFPNNSLFILCKKLNTPVLLSGALFHNKGQFLIRNQKYCYVAYVGCTCCLQISTKLNGWYSPEYLFFFLTQLRFSGVLPKSLSNLLDKWGI